MVDKHIGSALIVEDGKLLGIFTAMDACRVLAESLE
jgi:CBS domain-containing protein